MSCASSAGNAELFPPQRAQAQQQDSDHEDEGGKADEEADFDRLHARILPVPP